MVKMRLITREVLLLGYSIVSFILSNGREPAMTINEAICICRKTNKVGLDLVTFAQQFLHRNMAYSYTNSWDMPRMAFRKGRGYCWQQAKVLQSLLRALGFSCHMVYATQNAFPAKEYEGVYVKECISGHVWCRVRHNGVELDVCPGNEHNEQGKIHFTPISRVRRWNCFVSMGTYFASPHVNKRRYEEIMKAKAQYI